MSQIVMPRRRFVAGLLGLVAAPAIVKAASLMPVKAIEPEWPIVERSVGFEVQSFEWEMFTFEEPAFMEMSEANWDALLTEAGATGVTWQQMALENLMRPNPLLKLLQENAA